MNRNRLIALAAVLVLVLMTLTGCTAGKSTEEAYAATAWKQAGMSGKPAVAGVIHYTGADVLTSRMLMPEHTVEAVPGMGYAYVFAPGKGFDGLHIVFMDEVGNVLSTMDYDAMNLAYNALSDENPSQKTAYLNACNYMAFMYAEMLEYAVPLSADVKMNQWISFDEKQIDAMVK